MSISISRAYIPNATPCIALRPRGSADGKHQLLGLYGSHFKEILLSGDDELVLREGPRYDFEGEDGDMMVFDDATDSGFFFHSSYKKLMRLSRNNIVSDFAGTVHIGLPAMDGRGAEVRFCDVNAVAADGRGQLYVADGRLIRKMDAASAEVTTLAGSELPEASAWWKDLVYDASADRLIAASRRAIYHVQLPRSGQNAGVVAAARLLAGAPGAPEDGTGGAPRLSITAIARGPQGGIYILNTNGALMFMSPSGEVITLLSGALPENGFGVLVLSPGELLVSGTDGNLGEWVVRIRISGFTLRGLEAMGAAPPQPPGRHLHGLITPAAGGGSGGGGSPSQHAAVVTIRTGGQAFTVHRALLTAQSEYFERRLAPDSGFTESGGGAAAADGGSGGELALPDADPRAFGWLVTWMYDNRTEVPCELLRPAAVLADSLLLPVALRAQLQTRLVERATPGDVVSELIWAHQHNLSYMVSGLKDFFLRHRSAVPPPSLMNLVTGYPQLAVELMGALMS